MGFEWNEDAVDWDNVVAELAGIGEKHLAETIQEAELHAEELTELSRDLVQYLRMSIAGSQDAEAELGHIRATIQLIIARQDVALRGRVKLVLDTVTDVAFKIVLTILRQGVRYV